VATLKLFAAAEHGKARPSGDEAPKVAGRAFQDPSNLSDSLHPPTSPNNT
jgi:hypothetical protein